MGAARRLLGAGRRVKGARRGKGGKRRRGNGARAGGGRAQAQSGAAPSSPRPHRLTRTLEAGSAGRRASLASGPDAGGSSAAGDAGRAGGWAAGSWPEGRTHATRTLGRSTTCRFLLGEARAAHTHTRAGRRGRAHAGSPLGIGASWPGRRIQYVTMSPLPLMRTRPRSSRRTVRSGSWARRRSAVRWLHWM